MSIEEKIIGTLLPVSSLVSSNQNEKDVATFETGEIFIDWLEKSGQKAWQFLPLYETQLEPGVTGKRAPSPYKSYGIGFAEKYLSSEGASINPTTEEVNEFIDSNKDWIGDYALFSALCKEFGTDDWSKWSRDIRNREDAAIIFWQNKLKGEIDKYITLQWQLSNSYRKMRDKAKSANIKLIGDLPFYISFNSPLVWVYQEVFRIEDDGNLRFVSGVPNTPREHFGRQIWGHPLYDWDSGDKKDKIIKLWKIRLNFMSTLFDMVRFDHVNGFFEYGVLDTDNAHNDKYVNGPGRKVFEEIAEYCHERKILIIAENAGDNRIEMRSTLRALKIASSRVFRFGFNEKTGEIDDEEANVAMYPVLSVAYTTTHDTETLLAYIEILSTVQKKIIAKNAGVEYLRDDAEFAKRIRNAIIHSNAGVVIIPLQDWFLTRDRINIPGTENEIGDTNWKYRMNVAIENLPAKIQGLV